MVVLMIALKDYSRAVEMVSYWVAQLVYIEELLLVVKLVALWVVLRVF